MENIERHFGEELYNLRTTILCFEKILSLPDARFYSPETKEAYQKGLESARQEWSGFMRQLEQMPLSRRKQCLDLSHSPNKREIKYYRRVLLTANNNFPYPHNPPKLYGKGDLRIKNLKAMRDMFEDGLREFEFSDFYKARVRRRIQEIDEIIFAKKKVKGDKVGVVEYVKVYVPTDFYQVRY